MGVASYFEFCLCLPQHSRCPVSDEVQVLSSPDKVLHFPSYFMKSTNGTAPHTPEKKTNKFEKDTDGSDPKTVAN